METIMVKLPEMEEVNFSFEPQYEEIPIRGNYMATGIEQLDREAEAAVLRELENGNIYAWFCAAVTAEWRGIKETTYLGGCSYHDEKDFKRDHYDSMKDEAYKDLIATIKSLAK
ncbi:hypothetical protein [Chitinophaga arvensicola]|uniref:Uncharacterized protein n=1 Tax=Chitinophaga arvensicola TaxID=29529 RepID=A0A1I0PQV2_9BACT|nr:hypothetical protein [Chitinophaga arvensicola]SEW16683.1 hypothetical protein SAMN04488122_0917 [Chitinophaga arvensicola]